MSAIPTRDENGLDADGLDVVEGLVADATAIEGVANVHEGSSYFAERVIRRALKQGTLLLGRDPNFARVTITSPIDDRIEGEER